MPHAALRTPEENTQWRRKRDRRDRMECADCRQKARVRAAAYYEARKAAA